MLEDRKEDVSDSSAVVVSERVVIKIGGEELDITNIPPITLGDKKRLVKESGVNLSKLVDPKEPPNPEGDSMVVLLILQKVRPQTTIAEVDELSLFVAQRVLSYVWQRTLSDIDRPFSTPSTSSPTPTGGASGK